MRGGGRAADWAEFGTDPCERHTEKELEPGRRMGEGGGAAVWMEREKDEEEEGGGGTQASPD